MISGGFSLRGSYHEKNQDSYWSGPVAGGYVVALSDGLGSCKYSEVGARALCETVRALADSRNCTIDDSDAFIRQVEEEWSLSIRHRLYKIEDCLATALFAVVGKTETWLFRLGDGVLGAKCEGKTIVLYDPKEGGLVNITDCLGVSSSSWEKFNVATGLLQGIFVCSDGVADDNDEMNLRDLVEGIYTEYRIRTKEEIEEDLSHWMPTLKSSDDKTVAFLFQSNTRTVSA